MEVRQSQRRRWFQFRLSTWLVLIAILAWAMANQVWVWPFYQSINHFPALTGGTSPEHTRILITTTVVSGGSTVHAGEFDMIVGPTRFIKYALLTLAAFFIGKAGWHVAVRWRRRRALAGQSRSGEPVG